MKNLFYTFIALFFVFSCANNTDKNCSRKTTKPIVSQSNPIPQPMKEPAVLIDSISKDLLAYYPQYNSIDFIFDEMPSAKDSDAIFCCAASFTGQLLDDFNHFNIAGNHVSSGKFYKGYKCGPYNGEFIYYDGKWKFLMTTSSDSLYVAAQNGGMGFTQNMVVYNHVAQKSFRKLTSVNRYRTLCERNEKLCIIESLKPEPYSDYISHLLEIGVKHALYLDMGTGWNHSWYRRYKSDTSVVTIHPKTHDYQTNWIVFYK